MESAAPRAPRQPRRGPAPIASFDHDHSDESSPESKQTFQLPEIREDPASCAPSPVFGLAPAEHRARSHSSPALQPVSTPALQAFSTAPQGSLALQPSPALQAPPAPRIDISRASSSSHQDSRDSSPDLALFAGTDGTKTHLDLGFREDGALELRSSTEELAFLEDTPTASRPAPAPTPALPSTCPSRRHSRKDSQSSEVALLAVSGRTSRVSSVGSQCSAHSALSGLSRLSHLSVVSGVSRSPSPYKMLLETSFCGPKPIETDPEICAADVEERLLEMVKITAELPTPEFGNTRDSHEVCADVTIETPIPSDTVSPTVVAVRELPAIKQLIEDKIQKEDKNKATVEDRKGRSRKRRNGNETKVKKSELNHSKDIIRIKLKPDSEYEDDDEEDESECTLVGGEGVRKPITLDLGESSKRPAKLTELVGRIEPTTQSPSISVSPTPSRRRTPSPSGVQVSRKSSFCSLFKSRETIASPDSPSNVLRRKKSLTEGRSRSKSRDRSSTPTSTNKIKGSVLSLFKTPRKSVTSTSPSSRDGSPVIQPPRQVIHQHVEKSKRGDILKYYEDAKDGIIHISLHTPPEEQVGANCTKRMDNDTSSNIVEIITHPELERISTASEILASSDSPLSSTTCIPKKTMHRTVLPDGSILIPLHSPTEKTTIDCDLPDLSPRVEPNIEIDLNSTKIECLQKKEYNEKSDHSARTDWSEEEQPFSQEPVPDTVLIENGAAEAERKKKKEHIMFSTQVGSGEQVFSTQFSITKTPSVTSDMSMSFPSFYECSEPRTPPLLRDTHITSSAGGAADTDTVVDNQAAHDRHLTSVTVGAIEAEVDQQAARDSSGSEPSSEAAPARTGNDVEQRGLVVQESFEEELPFVPTTLPQERPLALPMVPVRERSRAAPPAAAALRRPRPPAPPAPARPQPPTTLATPPPVADKLRIQLPRRARASSASAPPRAPRTRHRTRSGSDGVAVSESRVKSEWIDFEDVPERRKQPKRIETVPAGDDGGREVVLSYVPPEQCRCECHHHNHEQTDQSPVETEEEEGRKERNVEPGGVTATQGQ